MKRNFWLAACLGGAMLMGACSKSTPSSTTRAPVKATSAAVSATTATTTTALTVQPASAATTPMQAAERMIDALARGDMAAATGNFDATMQGALPPAQLREVWGQLTTRNGAFQQRLNSKQEKIQGFDVVFTNCQFERAKLALQVTVDSQGKVSGFYIRPAF